MGMGGVDEQPLFKNVVSGFGVLLERGSHLFGHPDQVEGDDRQAVSVGIFDGDALGKDSLADAVEGLFPTRVAGHPDGTLRGDIYAGVACLPRIRLSFAFGLCLDGDCGKQERSANMDKKQVTKLGFHIIQCSVAR